MIVMKTKTETTMTTSNKGDSETISRGLSAFEEMDRLFDNYVTGDWFRPFRWHKPALTGNTTIFDGKTPCVDVIDLDNEILIKAELPGVEKKDLDISVTKNSVTIKGTTCHEATEEKGDYYHSEISRGSYQRTIMLPADVHEEKAKAKFKDGVLKLTLPKMEKSIHHKIKVD